jgi:hypothetical protein
VCAWCRLPGRTFWEVRELLEQLWGLGMRVLDDMKESVALAGLELARSLSQLTARLCNRDETPPEQVCCDAQRLLVCLE